MKAAAFLMLGATLLVGATVASVELGCRGPRPATWADDPSPSQVADFPGYRRDQTSTYFTFPEWYIVYVAEDYAAFLAENDESTFRYGSAISGFWHSFCTIKSATRDRGGPSLDVSVMIYTIGFSFSAEYAVKAIYEKTLGWVTEKIRGSRPTEEDLFAHRVDKDYAKFLYTLPWYKYPFFTEMNRLWRETPLIGESLVRKWERRFALTLEYAVKGAYGAVIQTALDVADDEDTREIFLVVRGLTDDDVAADTRIQVVRRVGDDVLLISVPRYQVFTEIALELSRKGRSIAEVAGNRRILMTVIRSDDNKISVPDHVTEVFSIPFLLRSGWHRVGLDVSLPHLAEIVPALDRDGVVIEHLFDY